MTPKGIDLLKQFEGFRDSPYRDAAGVLTVGYGTTFPLSEVEATLLLNSRMADFEAELHNLIVVPLSPNKWDAVASLVYNIGTAAFQTSHLRYLINHQASNNEIAYEWEKWAHAGGKVLPGLVSRRKAEVALWES